MRVALRFCLRDPVELSIGSEFLQVQDKPLSKTYQQSGKFAVRLCGCSDKQFILNCAKREREADFSGLAFGFVGGFGDLNSDQIVGAQRAPYFLIDAIDRLLRRVFADPSMMCLSSR